MGFSRISCPSCLNWSQNVVHSESALKENNVALAVVENLDRYWFCGNVLFSDPNIIKPHGFSSISLQPIKSMEMVDMSTRRSSFDLEAENRDGRTRRVAECQISEGGARPSSKSPHPIVMTVPELETIPPSNPLDKLAPVNNYLNVPKKRSEQRERWIGAKSTRYLELYELKGFMDLGFRFSRDDISPRLVSMISGLQQLGKQQRTQAAPISRPYLSEAWLIHRPHVPLLNWQIPKSNEQGVDMKERLMLWAREVASTVRQEC